MKKFVHKAHIPISAAYIVIFANQSINQTTKGDSLRLRRRNLEQTMVFISREQLPPGPQRLLDSQNAVVLFARLRRLRFM